MKPEGIGKQGDRDMVKVGRDVLADKNTRTKYDYLVENYGVTNEAFDTGIPFVHHYRDEDHKLISRLSWEAPNNKVEIAEVNKKALDLVDKEEAQNRERLIACWNDKFCSVDNFEFQSPLLTFLKTEGKTIVPSVFDDANPETREDLEVFIKVNEDLRAIRAPLHDDFVNGTKDLVEYRRALANAIFDYIRDPVADGGLGISFDSLQFMPERNIVQVITGANTISGGKTATKKATCTEFVKLYIALARQVGLEGVEPIEVYERANGVNDRHVRVSVLLPNDERIIFGLQSPDGVPEDDRWGVISELDLHAYDYSNRHMANKFFGRVRKSVRRSDKTFMEMTLDFSPRNYWMLSQYGVELALDGKYRRALSYLLKSRKENPYCRDTYWNLKGVYELLERDADARRVCREYFEMTGKELSEE